MNIQEKLGQRLKYLRQERSISQEAFADLCALDRTYISSIERGHRNVSVVNIEKIANALNISISTLFENL
jgi:transcriptional regulator with XRE-family HTH domain